MGILGRVMLDCSVFLLMYVVDECMYGVIILCLFCLVVWLVILFLYLNVLVKEL